MEEAGKAVTFALEKQEYKGRPLIYNREQVKVEAPVPAPGKIICVGHNYREHILEMKRELPPYPVVFAKFANTVIGPGDYISFLSDF